DTREKIVSVAERLFAERGFEATSMRDITDEAEVNLASVNYHFGSKEGLLKEIHRRRIEPMNRKRLELLDGFRKEAEDGAIPLEKIFSAFLRPFFETGAPGGRHDLVFARLLGRTFAEDPRYMKAIYEEFFVHIQAAFVGALRDSLPELSPADIHWRFYFSLNLMLASMTQLQRLNYASDGHCDPEKIDDMIERLIDFICAGFRTEPRS
ncbi:MAG: TetR/AcrR family transcriptional regulator, partial [Verrucomicrobiota bacterium]